jgi:hypothetical protein
MSNYSGGTVTKNVLDRTQTLRLKIARKRKYYGEQMLVDEGLLDRPEMKEVEKKKELEIENGIT